MKTTPVDLQELQVQQAIDHLLAARDILKCTNCPKTLARVRLALSSAKGALRNASYRRSASTYRTRKQIRKAPAMFVGVYKIVNGRRCYPAHR